MREQRQVDGRELNPRMLRPHADASLKLGYSSEDLAAVAEGANMGLGCGNPQAIAALRTGDRARRARPRDVV